MKLLGKQTNLASLGEQGINPGDEDILEDREAAESRGGEDGFEAGWILQIAALDFLMKFFSEAEFMIGEPFSTLGSSKADSLRESGEPL